MTTIITRSALIAFGRQPAPEIASIVRDWSGVEKVVTWADVMRARHERQARQLRMKRYPARQRRAFKLWVAYFDQTFYGGWHAFLDGVGNHTPRCWINKQKPELRRYIMRLIPLTLPLGSDFQQFDDWMIAFAQRFKRRSQDGKPVGVTYLWWDGGCRDGSLHLPAGAR